MATRHIEIRKKRCEEVAPELQSACVSAGRRIVFVRKSGIRLLVLTDPMIDTSTQLSTPMTHHPREADDAKWTEPNTMPLFYRHVAPVAPRRKLTVPYRLLRSCRQLLDSYRSNHVVLHTCHPAPTHPMRGAVQQAGGH